MTAGEMIERIEFLREYSDDRTLGLAKRMAAVLPLVSPDWSVEVYGGGIEFSGPLGTIEVRGDED